MWKINAVTLCNLGQIMLLFCICTFFLFSDVVLAKVCVGFFYLFIYLYLLHSRDDYMLKIIIETGTLIFHGSADTKCIAIVFISLWRWK